MECTVFNACHIAENSDSSKFITIKAGHICYFLYIFSQDILFYLTTETTY